MKHEDLENELKDLKIPEFNPSKNLQQIKMVILSVRQSMRISLWLLVIPFLFLGTAAFQSWLGVDLPPWSLLQHYGHYWPQWLRVLVFISVLIIIPFIAVIISLLSIVWFHYDRKTKVLTISVHLKRPTVVIIIFGCLCGLAFFTHSIIEIFHNK